VPSDGVNVEIKCKVPRSGIMDGVDSAQPDYPDDYCPDIENFRVTGGLWQTRLGSSLFKTLPGSGDVRLLADHYESTTKRVRLAAQGNTSAAALYDYVEGTDSQFQTTTGGTLLGGSTYPYFQGISLNSRFYFTDRAGALRKYQETPASGNQVRSVALPVAPTAAPDCKARFWLRYDSSNWATNSANFAVSDDSATTYNPIGTSTSTPLLPTAKFALLTTSAKGERLAKGSFATAQNPPSTHTVAFWVNQTSRDPRFQLEIGATTYDFQNIIQVPEPNTWYPYYVPIGDMPDLERIGMRCVASNLTATLYTSIIVYPGRLEGQYRWIYTHYDSTTLRESSPSATSNSGQSMDFSAIGVSYKNETARAMQKCCAMHFTSDSGVDSTTNKIRVYRCGGVPSLTVDSRGFETWYRVGEVPDYATTLAAPGIAVAATSMNLSAAPGQTIAIGTWLVIDPGTSVEEWVQTTTTIGAAGTAVSFLNANNKDGSAGYAHSAGAVVKVGLLENTANEQVNTLTRIFTERNDPPSGSLFVSKAPDGRIWLFGPNSQVAVSNKPTPERPEDYEVFPSSVDPLTRSDAVQGWTFEINGDTNDEAVVWGGFFQGYAHVFTKRNLYRINALSQRDWGPNAVEKLFSVGCIAGDTVCEVNGVLYWVADGPRVMRWAGQGPPESISHLRINARLNSAPTAYWNLWFARYHASQEGHYYRLYYVKSGQTTPTDRLDWNADNEAWERSTYRNSAGTLLAFRGASVRDAGSDVYELYQVDTAGNVYLAESGSTDNSVAITVGLSTKKFPLGYNSLAHSCYLRGAAATDSVTLVINSGGSEYGDVTHSYTESLAGTGDVEVKQRLHRDLKGRWVQAQISGSVSNRPAIREIDLEVVPFRSGRESA
jgi:hypothetical protein